MSKINLSILKERTLKIAQEITKADHSLYASKPQKASGEAKYIWRMVVFQVSKIPAHQCMPVTAEWELPEIYWDKSVLKENKNKMRKELDDIADEIVNTIPKSEWHGVIRWGHALGAF